ncbi:conserved hypothetical protein [Hyella patelloides LEGE 07179]|uniref:Uncharacterized protein n=1 Tax=Hyella patelloides LEGE 07179 TaxID=945734 RepID=A0A563VVZ5_9CYAN|nr:hypothetical protein [Hyella patelloides]VEP15567.1 conserved hypothetical protein [Hyella patelloides LEGE 07179]
MNGFVNDYLSAIAPHVSEALISPESFSDINYVAQTLPSAITDFFGFECRLGEKAAQADFLLSVRAAIGGREILAGYKSEPSLPAANFNHPVWKKVRNFSRHWANPVSPLYENADNIWLEFDLDQPPPEIPIPSLFFGVKQTEANTIDYQWVNQTALQLLFGRSLPSQMEQNLENCFKCLPSGAKVFQIGIMLARESEAVRICIRGIKSDRILEYLNSIGWSHEEPKLRTQIAQLSGLVDRIDLDIDVGNVIYPKIGLECYVNPSVSQQSQWELFLDYLVANQLCLTKKRDALLTYPGYSFEQLDSETWPTHLTNVSSLLGAGVMSFISRNIHHIKIVYQPKKPLEAKAYLSVSQGWLSKTLLKQHLKELHHASV